MVWFKKQKYTAVKIVIKKPDIPDGLWTKCPECADVIYNKQLEENFKVCAKCQYHFRMKPEERIKLLLDDFKEQKCSLRTKDPLNFPEYQSKLAKSYEKTKLNEAIIIGTGTINKQKVAFGVTDFDFMGASMGAVFGEMITILVENALNKQLPLIIVISSGGARMQEGVFSLMQMAKTSAALAKLNEAGLLYIPVITDPTTGGVTASFAMLGDIAIAEPKALIGFAGPRVIEQTIRQKLPKGFQRAEFLLEHGMIDMVVHRKDLKSVISRILSFFYNSK